MRSTQSRSVSAALAAGLATTAQAATCYSGVNIFTARGTGEVPANGLGIEGTHINAVIAAIPNSVATVVEYPASFANSSVPIGVQASNRQIAEYLDACPTSKIVVMGYSQGAYVQGKVLAGTDFSINTEGQAQNYTVPPLPQKYADQIVAIVFFGDPQYNKDIGTNLDNPYPCPGSSNAPRDVATFGDKFGSRLAEWANYDDFVCCSTGTSFNGHISYFSQENGTLTAEFVASKYGNLPAVSSSLTRPAIPASTFVSVSKSASAPSRPTASGSSASAGRPSSASSASRGSASGTGSKTTTFPAPTRTPTPAKGNSPPNLTNPFEIISGFLTGLIHHWQGN